MSMSEPATLAESIAAYRAAYVTMQPHEAAIQAHIRAAIEQIEAVGKEYRLYDSDRWAFGWVGEVKYAALHPSNFEADGIVWDLDTYDGTGLCRLSFSVLAAPRAAAEVAAKAAVAQQAAEADEWRAAKRARLAAELAALD